MNEIFVEKKNNYSLRGNNVLTKRRVNSVSMANCDWSKRFIEKLDPKKASQKYDMSTNIGGVFGALLTDSSKAFDCVPNDLFIAKFAYSFQTDALNLVYGYLPNTKQIVKINETFSCWKDIRYGVPQGSILYRSILRIYSFIQYTFMWPFYFVEDQDIASYADDRTI